MTLLCAPDGDADGHGARDGGSPQPGEVCPAGWVTLDDDCDDTRPGVAPGKPESCDGRDNDCDGRADEGFEDRNSNGQPDCVEVFPAFGVNAQDRSRWLRSGLVLEAKIPKGCAPRARLRIRPACPGDAAPPPGPASGEAWPVLPRGAAEQAAAVDYRPVEGGPDLAMRVPVGALDIRAFDRGGCAFRAHVDVVPDGLAHRPRVLRLGLPDRFIDHGEQGQLLAELGLDKDGIVRALRSHTTQQ